MFGVPQGCVLGTLLFLLMLVDIDVKQLLSPVLSMTPLFLLIMGDIDIDVITTFGMGRISKEDDALTLQKPIGIMPCLTQTSLSVYNMAQRNLSRSRPIITQTLVQKLNVSML